MPLSKQDKNSLKEILFVVLTGIGKFVFMDWLNWRLFFVITACLFWIAYIVYKHQKDAQILAYWGLSRKNFKKTFLELLPIAILSVIVFYLIGQQLGTTIVSWHIIPILILYPIWGIIQQFIIVGLIAKNLRDLKGVNIPVLAIILSTAIVFAIVHYPFIPLIIGTFLLALVYTTLYLKDRNLIVLGLYHGWLGAFFFYTIMDRDPWLEVFGVLG